MKSNITKWLRQGLLVLSAPVALILPASSLAQNIAITHCQGACPTYQSSLAATRANVVVHNLYAAGLNGDTGAADWVAYRLTREAVGVASLLPRFWQADRLLRLSGIDEIAEQESLGFSLAEISSSNSPYGGLNEPLGDVEERARLAPMTSFAKTPYWPELNNLSNMVPMPAPLRFGAWLQLEQTLNRIVGDEAELAVISGPLYLINQPLSTANTGTGFNPAAYFKVVVDDSGIAAFVFPQDLPQNARFCGQVAKLDQIELMSSLQLFPDRQLAESKQLLAKLGCS